MMKVLVTSVVPGDTQTSDEKALKTADDEVTPEICQTLCSNDCIIAFANIKLVNLKMKTGCRT